MNWTHKRVEQASEDYLREGNRNLEAFELQAQGSHYNLAYFKKSG